MLFCPACNGRVLVNGGIVATVTRPFAAEPEFTNTLFLHQHFLTCTVCPLVSGWRADGHLVEYPTLSTQDLQVPFIAMPDEPATIPAHARMYKGDS